jgi:hypothetical protein
MNKKISNICAGCGDFFKNSPRHYNDYGNFCLECSKKISAKFRWKILRKRIEKGMKLSLPDYQEFLRLTKYLESLGIDTKTYWEKEKQFEKAFYKVIGA